MVWTKIPDNANEEPALVRLSDAAWRLYVAVVVDDNRHKTGDLQRPEGVMSEARLTMIVPRYRKATLRTLVEAGLLISTETKGEYRLAGPLLRHQLSREKIMKLREDRSNAGTDGAKARWSNSKGDGKHDGNAMALAMADEKQPDGKHDAPYPVPRNPERPASSREDGKIVGRVVDVLSRLAGYTPDAEFAAELARDDAVEVIIQQLTVFADRLATAGETPLTSKTQRTRIRKWLDIARAEIESERRRVRQSAFSQMAPDEKAETLRRRIRLDGLASIATNELYAHLPYDEARSLHEARMAVADSA